MLRDVFITRLREYSPENVIDQENALTEIMQHYILTSLSRAGLFSYAMFHGGTCLSIVYGMNRFSEDLDFLLKEPDDDFKWEPYLNGVVKDCDKEGLNFEIQNRSQTDHAVRKAFLKTDSIGTVLMFELPFERNNARKIRIKLEVDTNPPAGSSFETSYLTFPTTAPITTQSLTSGFATKIHALLCRTYIKGRDWYDFIWYVAREAAPDRSLLRNALRQQGPWKGQYISVTMDWLLQKLRDRINSIDWEYAREDIRRFIPLREQSGLDSWSSDFFLYHVDRMAEYPK